MKSRVNILVDKSIAATLSAVEIYNKPDFQYRAETFCILAINGWELLLKAKWLNENNNKISSIYRKVPATKKDGSKSKRMVIDRTDSGNPRTHALAYLADRLIKKKCLDRNVWLTINALQDLRNSSVHFYNPSPYFAKDTQRLGTASLENYTKIIKEWFGRDLSEFNFYIMPLTFIKSTTQTKAVLISKEEKNFLAYLKKLYTEADNNDSRYYFMADINIKLDRTRSDDVADVHVNKTNVENAILVHMTEEQILEQYPWDYGALTKKCKERYSNFLIKTKYHTIRKSLVEDEDYCKIHYHNPKNPNIKNSKIFYKPTILEEFDKHYSRHNNST